MKRISTIILFLISSSAFSSLWNLNYKDKNLSNFTVNGKKLIISKGKGEVFTAQHRSLYENLRAQGKANSYFPFQWKLVNLSTGETIDQSKAIDKVFYGASSTKIMVGAAFLQKESDPFSSIYFQDLLNMIVVSSNTSWKVIQKAIGDGSTEQGRLFIHNFTKSLGLERTRGFWGIQVQ